MRWHGWLGLGIIVAAEALLYFGVSIVATWFTPIMWTGYILLADGLIARRGGGSWLTARRGEFGFLALLSVLAWLLFEVYNLKLRNWAYVGLPTQAWLRDLGFFWSFATITPAIFQTAELLARPAPARSAAAAQRATSPAGPGTGPAQNPRHVSPALLTAVTMVGLASVTIPPALPDWLAPYTFGFVWVGFIGLLEPANLRLGQPSLLRHWLEGRGGQVWRWLAAGLVCGLLWEAWNVQALSRGGAGWLYTMPQLIRDLSFGLHYGQMPLAGLLGFPPFAMECYALYYFLRWGLRLDRFCA